MREEYETDYTARVEEIDEKYSEHLDGFEKPENPPEEERAMHYLREGFGQAVWVYIEGRTGGRLVAFTEEEYSALEDAMNGWLELYALCYDEEIEADFTLRTVAKTLLDTRNVKDTAEVLTRVPGSDSG